mmetsp:Transcript_52634/g.96343  ORF Transcript_52634/g.96343 Transcript_52634/m.96343 type:complete len:259 (+) Transcript_52634:345-1121(+)
MASPPGELCERVMPLPAWLPPLLPLLAEPALEFERERPAAEPASGGFSALRTEPASSSEPSSEGTAALAKASRSSATCARASMGNLHFVSRSYARPSARPCSSVPRASPVSGDQMQTRTSKPSVRTMGGRCLQKIICSTLPRCARSTIHLLGIGYTYSGEFFWLCQFVKYPAGDDVRSFSMLLSVDYLFGERLGLLYDRLDVDACNGAVLCAHNEQVFVRPGERERGDANCHWHRRLLGRGQRELHFGEEFEGQQRRY